MMVVHWDRLVPQGGSSGSGWREVTSGKTEPREDETKRSPWKKKGQYADRLLGTSSLKEDAMLHVGPLLGNELTNMFL
jgi:hypothetical protein